jgi:hypothetical protein
MCLEKIPLVSMRDHVEGQVCIYLGARTLIGASGTIQLYICHFYHECIDLRLRTFDEFIKILIQKVYNIQILSIYLDEFNEKKYLSLRLNILILLRD